MSNMYKCDICGEVVDFANIAREIGIQTTVREGITAGIKGTHYQDGHFELKDLQEQSHRFLFNGSSRSSPDMCRACYARFVATIDEFVANLCTAIKQH